MKKWFLVMLVLGAAVPLTAHQVDVSSTMLIEQEDNTWVLSIRAAFTAFEHEIHTHYSDSAYSSPEEFNQLVIDYFREHLLILINDQDTASLSNPTVKLGHETSLLFDVRGIPNHIQSIQVSNKSFQDIYHSQSTLIILKKGMKKDQFSLAQNNEFTARLEVQDNYFTIGPASGFNPQVSLLYGTLAGILMILGVLVFLRINKVSEPT